MPIKIALHEELLAVATKMLVEACDSEDEAVAKEAARVLMDKEKKFLKMPNEKPPRRKSFNRTDTREWRNEYQREYRAENGDG